MAHKLGAFHHIPHGVANALLISEVITILSRCQRYDFKRISVETIADTLSDLMKEEGVDAEERALRYVAKVGDGSMRDSLSLLDQCLAFNYGSKLTYA